MKNAPFILVAAAFAASISTASADSIDNATLLCASMDDTGMLEERCKVVPGDKMSVQVRINTSASSAREICKSTADMMKTVEAKFDKGWELRIYAPNSKTRILAKCKLPN